MTDNVYLYALAHLLILAFPGVLFSHRLVPGIAARLCLAMAISFATAVYTILVAKWMTLTLAQAGMVWVALGMGLTLATFLLTRSQRPWSPAIKDNAHRFFIGGALFVVVVVVAYHGWAGAYLEIPADVLAHLNYSQSALLDLADGAFARDAVIGIHHDKSADYWYYLHAALAHVAGINIADSIQITSLLNTLSFVFAVYCFAHIVFAHRAPMERVCLSVLSVAFFVLHFGIGVFSFVRYYTFAPVMLNMLVFFGAMSLVLVLRRHRVSYGQLWWLAWLTGAASLVHFQEAMFIAIMTLGLWCYFSVQYRREWQAHLSEAPGNNWRRGIPITWVTLASITVLLALIVLVHVMRNRLALYEPKIVSIETYLPFFKHLYILNPTDQFYRVVTVLGVWLYVMFVVFKSRLYTNPYLTVGMLSPLFTVFNPVFVDFFTRLSGGHTLWRLCFLIPLPFMAAWLLMRLWQMMRYGPVLRRAASVLALVITLALLWPYQSQYFVAPYSRLNNIMPTDDRVSSTTLADLNAKLAEETQQRDIITDPVTGYVVSAMTQHRSMRQKFFTPRIRQLSIEYLSQQDRRLSHQGDLIIVNERDGPLSVNGPASGHWPDHILQFSRHYDASLLQWLREHGDWFEPIWEQDRITLYRIR